MPNHDSSKQLEGLFGNEETIKKISPKFNELSLEFKEISKHCKDPMFMAALLFKLAQ